MTDNSQKNKDEQYIDIQFDRIICQNFKYAKIDLPQKLKNTVIALIITYCNRYKTKSLKINFSLKLNIDILI